MSKTTTLHAFLSISLPPLHNYDVKWPNFKLSWERERQCDKFEWTPLRSPPVPTYLVNSLLLLSNRATWDNGEIVSKDAKSIFQQRFHGRCRCRIVRSLVSRRSRARTVKNCVNKRDARATVLTTFKANNSFLKLISKLCMYLLNLSSW